MSVAKKKVKRLTEEKNELEGLLAELLRNAVDRSSVPFSNERGGPRRRVTSRLLQVAADPRQRSVDPDLLLAATLVNSYCDVPAIALLQRVVGQTYPHSIESARTEKKAKK